MYHWKYVFAWKFTDLWNFTYENLELLAFNLKVTKQRIP